jgi:protein CSF1
MSPQVAVLDRLLHLSFVVSGTELIAVGSVGTIPKLYSYGSRFQANLQAQREGAARESKAFRMAHSPKPVNPLSAFANAMLQTARTRLREKEDNLSYVVQQRMQFSLGSLKLVVFPRTMEDNEMASFGASELRADLDLIIESNDLPAKRKLLLAFAGMSASRVGPLSPGVVPDDIRTDVRKWLDALRKRMPVSTIFELPAMDMDMESEEIGGILEYNFESKFAQGGKPTARREDIFITLNVALYSWLTLLRKNLAREMSQAQGSVDRRQAAVIPTVTPSGASTPGRRRTITESSTLDTTSPPAMSQIDRHVPLPRALTGSNASMERHHKTTLSMSAMPSGTETLGPPIELAMPFHAATLPLDVATTASSNTQPPPSPIAPAPSAGPPSSLVYQPRRRHIERLQMRQLGEATPDVMHPFFTKKAGFSLEDALPQYVHEYATMPIEEITRALLKLYSQQLSHSAPR